MSKKICATCKHFRLIDIDVSPSVFDGICHIKNGKRAIMLGEEKHTMYSFGYAYSGGHCDKYERSEK